MKKISTLLLSFVIAIGLFACANKAQVNKYGDAFNIVLSENNVSINGKEIESFDYTWHVDPTVVHDEVKNAPAEYYTGTKPNTDAACYIDHELYYYPELDSTKFKLVNYDGEQEWAYYYEDGVNNEYIFSTLPSFHGILPNDMMHSSEEAEKYQVLHITKPGTYVLQGKWLGQISIDLGDKDEMFSDENAKVTIVLNGVDIDCSVAPCLVFNSVYECDNTWKEKETYSYDVDTANAGANIIIADNTVNNINGANIYRMLKTIYKNEDSKDQVKVQKKLRKIDSPLYSYVSLNVNGEEKGNGILNIESSFEGLGTELHLTIFGGNININSLDDGINVNEDDVSVASFKGGNILINAANGQEGDGVDSNGFIVVDGSNLTINNIRVPDNALDSATGIEYISGNISVNGKTISLEPGSYMEIGENGPSKGFGPREDEKPMDDLFNMSVKDLKEKIENISEDVSVQEFLNILGIVRNEPPKDNIPPNDDKTNVQPPRDNVPPNDKPLDEGRPMDDKRKEPFNDMSNLFDQKINIKKLKDKLNELDDSISINDILSLIGVDAREIPGAINPRQ